MLPFLTELDGISVETIMKKVLAEESKKSLILKNSKNDRNGRNTLKKQYSARILKKPLNVSLKLANDVQTVKSKKTFDSLLPTASSTTSLISLQKKVINILSERQRPEFTAKTFHNAKNELSMLESIDSTKSSEKLGNLLKQAANLSGKLQNCNKKGKMLKNEVKGYGLIVSGIKLKLKVVLDEYKKQIVNFKGKVEEVMNIRSKEMLNKLKEEVERRKKAEADKKRIEISLQLLKEQYGEVKRKLNGCKQDKTDDMAALQNEWRDKANKALQEEKEKQDKMLEEMNEWKSKCAGIFVMYDRGERKICCCIDSIKGKAKRTRMCKQETAAKDYCAREGAGDTPRLPHQGSGQPGAGEPRAAADSCRQAQAPVHSERLPAPPAQRVERVQELQH
eukprot:TRINITY_DN13924_c0_g1_i2.p1 TRINITY_DN13924_c0_g1~~TRINITY_DN13924_c0_g1_i2.p1  ORF type:complete len:393 (+),score=80.29 TRINITY_DN13924_c0_g1_i2:487-1665(+)